MLSGLRFLLGGTDAQDLRGRNLLRRRRMRKAQKLDLGDVSLSAGGYGRRTWGRACT